MSISYLTSPNDFSIYSKNLTVSQSISTPNDAPSITQVMDLYGSSGTYIENGVFVNSRVFNGIAYLTISNTSNVSMGSNNETSLIIANLETGFFNIPTIYISGQNLNMTSSVITNTGVLRDCNVLLDSDSGGPGLGRITLTLPPFLTFAGSTATMIPNSNVFNNQIKINSFSISYPTIP